MIDPPDRTLTIAADVDVGGRRVELRYLGRGHTDGDIVVNVPDAGVLFAGDLLENGATPWFGDGYPMDWPATVERMKALATGSVVPGHGAVGDRSLLERQLAEFRLVAALARRVHDGRLDRATAMASMPYPRRRTPSSRSIGRSRSSAASSTEARSAARRGPPSGRGRRPPDRHRGPAPAVSSVTSVTRPASARGRRSVARRSQIRRRFAIAR